MLIKNLLGEVLGLFELLLSKSNFTIDNQASYQIEILIGQELEGQKDSPSKATPLFQT